MEEKVLCYKLNLGFPGMSEEGVPEGGRISVRENERENSDLNEFKSRLSISWRETKLNGSSRRSVQ